MCMRQKLLIVDDEKGIVDMMADYFAARYDVLTAYSGGEALKTDLCSVRDDARGVDAHQSGAVAAGGGSKAAQRGGYRAGSWDFSHGGRESDRKCGAFWGLDLVDRAKRKGNKKMHKSVDSDIVSWFMIYLFPGRQYKEL